VLVGGVARVTRGHGEDLGVRPLLVGHPEDADGPDRDQAAGERGLVQDDHGVERVTVLGQRAGDEAIVMRIPGRGEQHPVQPDRVDSRIVLILVPGSLRDLDDDVDFHSAQPNPAGPGLSPGRAYGAAMTVAVLPRTLARARSTSAASSGSGDVIAAPSRSLAVRAWG